MLATSRSGKKRKAQWSPSSKLAVFVIAIAVLVVLVVLFGRIMRSGERSVDKDACTQSVKLNANAKLSLVTGFDASKYIIDGYGNAVELQCATEYLEVKGDEPEVLNKKIADSMVDCWQMYGEGELEVFNTEDNNYCAVCSRLEFKEETMLPGFTNYLMTHQAPGQDITYLEYFKQTGKRCGGKILPEEDTPGVFEDSDLTKVDTLDTSSPLAVMFVMGKNAYPNGFVEAGEIETATIGIAIGAGVGGAVGLIVGAALCLTGAGCIVGGPIVIAAVGSGLVGAAAVGIPTAIEYGLVGYAIGSSCTANYDAYVVLWNYSDMGSLDCTYLESESTPLKVREI